MTGARQEPRDGSADTGLVEILALLIHRRWLFVAVLLVVSGLIVTWTLLRPERYLWTSTLELGLIGPTDAARPVEDIAVARAKLDRAFLPEVQEGGDRPMLDVKALAPGGDRILLLQSRGAPRSEERHRQVHRRAAERLIEDHRRITELTRLNLESERDRARARLESLSDQLDLLEVRGKGLATRRQLAAEQAATLRAEISDALRRRQSAAQEVQDASQAMTLLMLDSELRENRAWLSRLDEQLRFGFDEEQARLTIALAENGRDRAEQESAVSAAESRLAALLPTRVLALAVRSPGPVGPGPERGFVVAAVAGPSLALIAVLLLQALGEARARAASKEGEGERSRPAEER